MKISVRDFDLHVLNMRTRMPFKYGVATLTALPYVMARVRLEVAGQSWYGLSAEGLAPKWFTKDPDTTFEEELQDMVSVIQSAGDGAVEIGDEESVYSFWRTLYARQEAWAVGEGHPSLLWAFGVTMMERAVIDAFCRATSTPVWQAIGMNSLGIDLGGLHPELSGSHPADYLPAEPLRKLHVRHTVGLSDPLWDDEISPEERVDDGLPQSFEAAVRGYGLSYFKIKVGGNPEQDVGRLVGVDSVLKRAGGPAYAITLDGNEQYRDPASFRDFWELITHDANLETLVPRILFVEQPYPRDVSLGAEVGTLFTEWPDRPPTIIDEADGELSSLRRALDLGYAGTSHKNCKGVIKGIANTCFLEYQRRRNPGQKFVISGEDLCSVGPIAMWQDLAVVSALGIGHVERNGHHYYRGLSMWPEEVQSQVIAHHGDLYCRHDRGFATLNIREGQVDAHSIIGAPFGYGFEIDPTRFTPLADWQFEELA